MVEGAGKDREKEVDGGGGVAGEKESGERGVHRSEKKEEEPHVAKDDKSAKSSRGGNTLVPNKPEPTERIKKTENSAKNEVSKHRRRTSIPL